MTDIICIAIININTPGWLTDKPFPNSVLLMAQKQQILTLDPNLLVVPIKHVSEFFKSAVSFKDK